MESAQAFDSALQARDMTIKRLDHVNVVVVEDLEAATGIIVALAEELFSNTDNYLLTNDKPVR